MKMDLQTSYVPFWNGISVSNSLILSNFVFLVFSCRTESAAALGKTFLGGRGGRGRRMSHLKFFKRYRVGDLFRISRGSQGQILSNLGLVKGRGGGIF